MQFDWVAENYNKNSQFQFNHAEYALSQYSFKGNEDVLDVGCGDGKITSKIAKLVPKGTVLGIDNSKSMIDFAQKTFSRTQGNLSFEVCRAEDIHFINTFDLIVSFACLHWVRDQISFLTGAKNALKINGKIIITLYPKHPDIWDAIEGTVKNEKWLKYFSKYSNPHISYDLASYELLIKEAGLKTLFIEEQMPIAYFTSRSEAEAFLRSWLPHTDQVDYQLREKFIKEIIHRFLSISNIQNENNIGIPFRRLDVILEK
jgi:ubiquinone/menaquinone biosynthesis C-methylase UbiE